MVTVHKKHAIKSSPPAEDAAENKTLPKSPADPKKIIVSEIIVAAAEQIEVADKTPAEKIDKEEKVAVGSLPTSDPLTDFKEKMNKEEQYASFTSQKKSYMWPILFIFIIALLLMAGVFFYRNGGNAKNANNKVNVVALSLTPTAIPEPTKAIDLTQYRIEVLNGSGVSGEAGKQKDNLETEGFAVSSVGNADNSDYTDTVIKTKKEIDKGFLDKLKTTLESSFVLGNEETLPEDADSDIVIIIGSNTN